jgi:hypothetical protein
MGAVPRAVEQLHLRQLFLDRARDTLVLVRHLTKAVVEERELKSFLVIL